LLIKSATILAFVVLLQLLLMLILLWPFYTVPKQLLLAARMLLPEWSDQLLK
jgi:hypothetical protein